MAAPCVYKILRTPPCRSLHAFSHLPLFLIATMANSTEIITEVATEVTRTASDATDVTGMITSVASSLASIFPSVPTVVNNAVLAFLLVLANYATGKIMSKRGPFPNKDKTMVACTMIAIYVVVIAIFEGLCLGKDICPYGALEWMGSLMSAAPQEA
jgi:uncharacterized membrane protein YoaK (UPF0700 family)